MFRVFLWAAEERSVIYNRFSVKVKYRCPWLRSAGVQQVFHPIWSLMQHRQIVSQQTGWRICWIFALQDQDAPPCILRMILGGTRQNVIPQTCCRGNRRLWGWCVAQHIRMLCLWLEVVGSNRLSSWVIYCWAFELPIAPVSLPHCFLINIYVTLDKRVHCNK